MSGPGLNFPINGIPNLQFLALQQAAAAAKGSSPLDSMKLFAGVNSVCSQNFQPSRVQSSGERKEPEETASQKEIKPLSSKTAVKGKPKRRKKQQQSRTMSSFQVFSHFVKVVDGVETGDDILSKECFEMWLRTRDGVVVHPEESFRRTLIAHIRGVYGRKPFGPTVEASLLKLLRETCREKKPVNAWERCFPLNASNIGKRGFNKLGYHEELAKKGLCLDENGDKVTVSSSNTPIVCDCPGFKPEESGGNEKLKKLAEVVTALSSVQENKNSKKRGLNRKESTQSKKPTSVDVTSSGLVLQNTPQQVSSQLLTSSSPVSNGVPGFSTQGVTLAPFLMNNLPMFQQEGIRLVNLVQAQAETGTGLLSEFSKVFVNSRQNSDIIKLHQVSAERGLQVLSPAVAMYMQGNQYASDPRLNLNHLLPPQKECIFFPDKPVGRIMFNMKTWLIEECNVESQMVFGKPLLGVHCFEILESPLESLISFAKFYPRFKENGHAWYRLRGIKADKSRMGLLLKMTPYDEDRTVIHFQDQSNINGHLLAIPMFL